MARLDRQTFEELSVETGFQIDVLEKVYRLIELLREISDLELRNKLVLKGGTAINFLYFDYPRLSVDIDLDYIGAVEKEEMLEEREKILGTLERLFQAFDYETRERSSYALNRHDLFYENSAGNRDRVQVEINFLKRSTILEPREVEFSHPFDFASFPVLTLRGEELFGRKFSALAQRSSARDLYDVYELLSGGYEYDKATMKKCFLFSVCLDQDPRQIRSASEIMEAITYDDVRRRLLPLLQKDESIDLDQLKNKVQPLVKQFLTLNEGEAEFVTDLFEDGRYRPDLLFEETKYSRFLVDHPGIEWRLENMD